MLYEVITPKVLCRFLRNQQNAPFLEENHNSMLLHTWYNSIPQYFLLFHVITSYSIHYTKLYEDPNSVLNHFRKMVKLRKDNEVLVYGDYELLQAEHPDIYAFTRTLGNVKMLVLLNFRDHDSSIELSELKLVENTLINNYDSIGEIENEKITLKPYQAVILLLN